MLFPAGNVKSILPAQRNKCGLLEFFLLFFWRHLAVAAALWMLLTFYVCVGSEGLPRKDSGTQTDKITHRHLQRVSLLPPPTRPTTTTPPPLLPAKTPSAAPRTSLGGYFHSRKCWVTEGSTSSQQSGLKFNESLDAYFIVRQASIHHAIHPSGCMPVLTFP